MLMRVENRCYLANYVRSAQHNQGRTTATHVISINLAVIVLWERESRGQQVRLFSPSVSRGVSAIKFTVWWTSPSSDSTHSDEKLLLGFNAWFVAHLRGHSYEANWAQIANIRRTVAPSVGCGGWRCAMRLHLKRSELSYVDGVVWIRNELLRLGWFVRR